MSQVIRNLTPQNLTLSTPENRALVLINSLEKMKSHTRRYIGKECYGDCSWSKMVDFHRILTSSLL